MDDDDDKSNKIDKDNDINNQQTQQTQNDTDIPSFPFLPAIIATILFVSFWPLLAIIRNGYIDIDMYMALKGILDDNTANVDSSTTILELPALSPAERLVDAIFGPP